MELIAALPLIDDIREAVEYFRASPAMLLVVVALAVCAGLLAHVLVRAFRKLPPKRQRSVRLWGWGIGNVFATLFLAAMIVMLVSLALVFFKWAPYADGATYDYELFGYKLLVAAILGGCLAGSVLGYQWWQFVRAVRAREHGVANTGETQGSGSSEETQ